MIQRALITCGLALFVCSGLVFAQRGGGRGGGSGGDAPGGGRALAVDRLAAISQALNLTAPEQATLQGIFDEAQKQASLLVQQAIGVQDSLLDAARAGRDTAASVQKLASIRAQIKMVEADAFKQALSRLDESKRKKAPKLYELMNGMFLSTNWRNVN